MHQRRRLVATQAGHSRQGRYRRFVGARRQFQHPFCRERRLGYQLLEFRRVVDFA